MDSPDPHWIQWFTDFQIGDGYNFDTLEKTHAVIDGIEEERDLKFDEARVIKMHRFTEHLNEQRTVHSNSETFVKLKAKVLNLLIPGLTFGGGFEFARGRSRERMMEDDVSVLHISVQMQTGILRLDKLIKGRPTSSSHETHYVSALSYGGYLNIDITVRTKSRKEKRDFDRTMGAELEATFKGNGPSFEAKSTVKEIDDYLKRTEECTVNINSSVSALEYDTSESNSGNLTNLQELIDRFIDKVEEQNDGRGKPLLAKITPLFGQYRLENRLGSQIKDLEDWYDDICTALSLLREFFQFMEERQGVVDFPDEIRHLERALRKLRDSFTETIQGLTHRYSDYEKNKEIIKNLERKYEEFSPTAVGTRRCIGKVKTVTGKYKMGADADERLPGPHAKGDYTNLVAVGKVGRGKSSTCNSLVEKEGVFKVRGPNGSGVTEDLLEHCTTVGGRKLRVIDTPGLLAAISDNDQLDILQKLSHCVSMLEGDTGIDAFMFVISCCDEEQSQEELDAVVQLATLFSESMFEYMIVVATHKDMYENKGKSTEYFREKLHDKMKTILQKAGNRMVFINNETRDPNTRRGYIISIIELVDVIAKNHKGKKFTHECIEKARIKRKELKTKNPNLSRVAIQKMLAEETSKYIISSYWCFASSATVRLSNGSVALMSALKTGDRVLCRKDGGSIEFEEVFCFGHADGTCQSSYVYLETLSGRNLLLSDGHYIVVNTSPTAAQPSLKPARDIHVGDTVVVFHSKLGAMVEEEIVTVDNRNAIGAFCPHTRSGTIVVNDILVSCYTEAVDPLLAKKLLAPALCLYEVLPLSLSAPLLKEGVSNACKILSSTKEYISNFDPVTAYTTYS